MVNKILVVAPHPDDETLGCGGTLLKHKKNGDKIYWMVITDLNKEHSYFKERQNELKKVKKFYKFDGFINLQFEPASLSDNKISDLLLNIEKYIKIVKPNTVYVPYIKDVHSDHQIIAKAMNAFSKWFRYPYIKRFIAYETISETNFNFTESNFSPNLFIDITKQIKNKIKIMKIYKSEFSVHPFPRSEKSIESLAALRGSTSGYLYAEAFQILIERR